MENSAYLLALQSILGLGPIRLKSLLDYFQDPKMAWEAKTESLVKIGMPKNVCQMLTETRKKLDPFDYLKRIEKLGIKWLTIFQPEYPKVLKEIYDPPLVLFYQGNPSILNQKAVAVVGTRKITSYGKFVTEKFTKTLAETGLVIVSGLARGVDTVAHQATLAVEGQTVAVLGGGLKNIFPPENFNLAQKIIAQKGIIISEFAPDEPSLPGNFPARNRIISGLSLAVLVTEAAEDSGSLITARLALEQGREVFAVPGPITSDYSKGPLSLIKQGAKLVTEPEEVMMDLGISKTVSRPKEEIKLGETEEKILAFLDTTQHIDHICQQLHIKASEVAASLVRMEIYGLVKNLGGGNYTKVC